MLVCNVSDLADGQAKGFTPDGERENNGVFVVQRDGQIYGYYNRCPHTGINLNWMPDQFLDLDGRFIQCSVHGALFRVEDGMCVWGPCLNQALEPAPIEIHAGQVYVRM